MKMGMQFKARVLLELGAELISSDAVAIYELVKNGIDAKAKHVKVDVQVGLQNSAYRRIRYKLQKEAGHFDAEAFVDQTLSNLDSDISEDARERIENLLSRPKNRAEALRLLDEVFFQETFIRIEDNGGGMSLETLQKGYLTVGTPMRLLEKSQSTEPSWEESSSSKSPILGEKGIGRLAAMRLGHHIFVETVTAIETDKNWRKLELDWRPVYKDPNLDSSALEFEPQIGRKKENKSEHGTIITIRDIQSDWTPHKTSQLINGDLAKLSDPFAGDYIVDLLRVTLQGKIINLTEFDTLKLKNADAICTASFKKVKSWDKLDPVDGLELSVEVDYKFYPGAKRTWHLRSEHLTSTLEEPVGRRKKVRPEDHQPDGDIMISALPHLGPFEMKFYWFNRGRMMRYERDLWNQIQGFVNNWSGGLLVYRDGFRVYPYGSPSDDWLDLDRKALSASAYKLNRAQIIGYLRISHEGNPALVDQTSREGFRDCAEKEALRRLLRHVIITKCKVFLEDTVKERKEDIPEDIETLEERVGKSEVTAVKQLHELQNRIPEESGSISEIIYQIGEIREAWERAKATIKDQESELEQYIHLAGVGLQVEFIAHELSRVTGDTLRSLKGETVINSAATREGLELQLKTLEKRIRVLDLLSIPGRQHRKQADIGEIVQLTCDIHEAKIKRHAVQVTLEKPSGKSFRAKVEKGQIIQILDNLFSNSFYWLAHRFDRKPKARIDIVIDSEKQEVRFTDNGPGIPEDMAEDVFKPFVTTKPPGDGRGLGLFISRRLAEYNDGTLSLAATAKNEPRRTFVLSLKSSDPK